MLRIILNHENQGEYMIMVLVSDGASYLLGYSDQQKMHAVFKLSEIFLFATTQLDFVHYEGKQSAYSSRLNKRD